MPAERPMSAADDMAVLFDMDGLLVDSEPFWLAESDRAAEEVAEWFLDGMAERMAGGVPWKPGAAQLLAELRSHGVRTALVSSSYRRMVDVVLADLPPDTFDVSVAGDEVVLGKPDPEPYLRALALLACSPTTAVVLEDSEP